MSIVDQLSQIKDSQDIDPKIKATAFWGLLASHLGIGLREDSESGFIFGRFVSKIPKKNIDLALVVGDAGRDYWISVNYEAPKTEAEVAELVRPFGADSVAAMDPARNEPTNAGESTRYLVKFDISKISDLVCYLTRLAL